jgi:hypothetical protein
MLFHLFQILSLFVMKIFANSHGFAGLFLATLYGGALRFVMQIMFIASYMFGLVSLTVLHVFI